LALRSSASARWPRPTDTVREGGIGGDAGVAMEPFVSRDARFLLFSNSND
jgi:hypothetical protein